MSFLRKYCLTTVWCVVIFVLSVMNVSNIDAPHLFQIPYIDKWIHLVLYLVLGFLLCYEVRFSTFLKKMFVWAFPAFYGGAMELIQEFVVHRSGDVVDFAADVLGACMGILLCYLIFCKRWKQAL